MEPTFPPNGSSIFKAGPHQMHAAPVAYLRPNLGVINQQKFARDRQDIDDGRILHERMGRRPSTVDRPSSAGDCRVPVISFAAIIHDPVPSHPTQQLSEQLGSRLTSKINPEDCIPA
ncbi:hypothetical protein CcaCcLH18_06022 [Colletotrichum camelliae]|nr:hypothetical protein CcaCcLH18_06022 [Colletotrichum camelliae]